MTKSVVRQYKYYVCYTFLMKAGIKVGLNSYRRLLPKTRAKVCEVYFRFDQKTQYPALFGMLKDCGIEGGLHFWGLIDNYLYNLAYPDESVQSQSVAVLKETIDIASRYKLRYVNVHPGNYQLVKMDFDKGKTIPTNKPVAKDEGNAVLYENIELLNNYSLKKNVLFLTETLACRENLTWHNDKGRLNPVDINCVPVTTIIELAAKGYLITNDIGHTLSDEIGSDRKYLFNRLMEKSQKLKKQTRLIHTNTTRPPFTGIDTHSGVLDEDFSQNVLPDKNQLKEFLKIFPGESDIWLIPEPLSKHEENFSALTEILQQVYP